jgi:cation diffusion facilitator CzcD-associated flavoprotein CzcO
MYRNLISIFLSAILINTVYSLETRRSEVIILGAGASGIAAARQLQKKGIHDFLIIDALPFAGGWLLYLMLVAHSTSNKFALQEEYKMFHLEEGKWN